MELIPKKLRLFRNTFRKSRKNILRNRLQSEVVNLYEKIVTKISCKKIPDDEDGDLW